MKRKILTLAFAAAALALPTTSWAAIAGTPHDLSGRGWGSTEICIFCHTPHNAKAATAGPLWNHTDTAASFTLYSSSTLNSSPTQPSAASKGCLSCHDGTVAIDSYGSRAGTVPMTGSTLIGTDLANDHPVSITYDTALVTADGGLAATNTIGLPLFSSKLECATCHDVHNNALGNFLRLANASSALCLKCHTK